MKKLQDMKLDFNAMCNFEIATGQPLMDFISKGELTLNNMRLIAKIGLNVDIQTAGEIINEYISESENAIEDLSNIFAEKFKESGLFGKKK